MKKIILVLLLSFPLIAISQHTFSIVAVDSVTGEIGSAGATCGDSIIWPGTPGAKIISDIIPGVGAIHTQSYYLLANQTNAHNRMALGDSPQDIIAWLISNDVNSNPSQRQYGIVDLNNGSPRSAAYTGSNCFNYKNHILGPNYAIQGNILLGQQILDSMESRFNATPGCLSDKLMAAMQGAKVIGADTRCLQEGTSSLSAFLRVAKPTDHPDSLYIDLNIAGTAPSVEPIDALQTKYNNWKNTHIHICSPVLNTEEGIKEHRKFVAYPNPTNGILTIEALEEEITRITVIDVLGKEVMSMKPSTNSSERIQLDLSYLTDGNYVIALFQENDLVIRGNITLQNDK